MRLEITACQHVIWQRIGFFDLIVRLYPEMIAMHTFFQQVYNWLLFAPPEAFLRQFEIFAVAALNRQLQSIAHGPFEYFLSD